ncbi:MAG TPA: HPr family phosphocarrier protein [Pseudoflavonifractor sp.]|nr:HPr family phosphocarrier protein [Pseudoflavonifractor sp.]
MYTQHIVIQNKTGLHARPASMLLELAQQFESEVMLFTEDEEINAKSIISILAGGITAGTEVRLEIEGRDEDSAGKAISDLLHTLPD